MPGRQNESRKWALSRLPKLGKCSIMQKRLATALDRSPAERARVVRDLIEKVMVDEKTIIIKLRPGALLWKNQAGAAGRGTRNRALEARSHADQDGRAGLVRGARRWTRSLAL